MEVEIFKKTMPIVYITGPIVDGDAKKFASLTAKYPAGRTLVVLHSDGGSLVNGLDIGLMIRERRMSTVVYGRCVSVCGMMWLAGAPRAVAADARIGFHSAYTVKDDKAVTSGGANALAGGYLVKLGFKWSTIHYLTNTDPEEVEWLNDEKAKELGVSFTMLKAAGINKPANDTTKVVTDWPPSNTVALPGIPTAPARLPATQDYGVAQDVANKEYTKRLVPIPPSGQCPAGTQLEPKFKRYCLMTEYEMME